MRKSGEPEKKLGLIDIGCGDWRGQLNEMCNNGFLATVCNKKMIDGR
jgi:hypothetical protein